jgi:hypothetical protein
MKQIYMLSALTVTLSLSGTCLGQTAASVPSIRTVHASRTRHGQGRRRHHHRQPPVPGGGLRLV